MAKAKEDNKPSLPDNQDEQTEVLATPRLFNLVMEIRELGELLNRLKHFQETGEGSYEEIEEAAKRRVPIAYTDAVRDALGPYSRKYLEFMDVIDFYRRRREGVLVTIGILKRVLKKHPDLLLRFNDYLPDGFQINLPVPDKPEYKKANEVIDILNKFQEKLELDENRYLILMYNLSEYHNGNMDFSVLKQRIEDLFRNKPDVLILCFGFIDILTAHRKKSGDSKSDKNDKPIEDRKDDSKRDLPIENTNSVLEPRSEEYGDFDSSMLSYLTESDKSNEVPVKYTDSVRDALGPNSMEYIEFMDLMSLYQSGRKGILKTIMQLKKLLKEHQDLLGRFNAYLPAGYHIPIAEAGKSEGREAIGFYIEVQEKLQDDDSRYLSLQMLLGEHRWGNTDSLTVKQEIHALFPDRKDLAEICCNYVVEHLGTPSDEQTNEPQMPDDLNNAEGDKPLIDVNSVEDALGHLSQKYRDLFSLISKFKEERTGISEITSMLKDLMKDDPELAMEIADHMPTEDQCDSLEALAFLGKVEREFKHDKQRCISLQNILRAVQEHKDTEVTKRQVAGLFHDRPDLFEEFLSFF